MSNCRLTSLANKLKLLAAAAACAFFTITASAHHIAGSVFCRDTAPWTPLAGVVVTLQGTLLNTYIGTTAQDGTYYISLPTLTDTYTVTIATPAGLTISAPAGGQYVLPIFANGVGGPHSYDDAGFELRGCVPPPASIGDQVFNDLNANGVQDGGSEIGVNGVTVKLYRCSDDSLVGTTATAGGGLYGFSGLVPGDYYVIFSGLPAGFVFSPSTAGAASDPSDSDANPGTGRTDCTTLVAGENDPTWDAGIYQPASIGDQVFNDLNANGVQDGGSEVGVNGVTVKLYRCSDDSLVGTTATAGGGLYGFSGLVPGDYYVIFSGLPAGFVFSPSTAGAASDPSDSDANPATGKTDCTTLVAGENDPTWDAGIYQPASIGDQVFNDLNANGVQDGGSEVGVNGVTVKLYRCSDDSLVGTTATAGGGLYGFSGLVPGDYYVIFSGLPAGFVFSPSTPGGASDPSDSDANPGTGRTDCTTLAAGENDPTWDAGIYQPCVALVVSVNSASVCQGSSAMLTATVSSGTGPFTYGWSGPGGYTATTASISVSVAGTYNVTVTDSKRCSGSASGALSIISSVCVPSIFNFDGSSAASGTLGNIRTFTTNGISVKVSAFSRVKGTGGAWATAYLGQFGGGLGVTDSSEGSGGNNSHTVDNITRDNYVLFEFSEPVVLNRANLGFVVSDSDVTLWIRNSGDPFNNHLTLNDAVLASFGYTEENLADNSSPRWVDLNASEIVGNAVVIAAWPGDTTPEDQFKISLLDICKPTCQPLALACVSATSGQVGVLYSSALVPSGGLAPYTFSIVSGSLPSGLSLNPNTGAITGTPTTAGPFNFTAKVTDSLGAMTTSGANGCSITIAPSCIASICGSVLRDCDANGSVNGEAGLGGWTVTLKNTGGGTVDTTTTAANGTYCFNNVAAGTYDVVVTPKPNYVATYGCDSSNKIRVTLASCQNKTGVTFGYTGTAPGVNLVVTGPSSATCGQTITYAFAVTNTGNTCLYGGMRVDAPLLGGQVFYQTPVSPGDGFVFTKTYVVQSGNAPTLVMTATALGIPPGSLANVTKQVTVSTAVTCVPAAGLPSPWKTMDIGTVGAVGGASAVGGKFTITGSGKDIGGKADGFRYVYQTASGDCSVVAKVTGVQNTDPGAKAGVMVRETLNANARHASTFVTSANGIAFQYRSSSGGTSGNVSNTGLAAPYWVKIVRSGSTFTSSRSATGANGSWTVVGTQTISMGASVYIGLAVTSHKEGTLCTATVESVTATP